MFWVETKNTAADETLDEQVLDVHVLHTSQLKPGLSTDSGGALGANLDTRGHAKPSQRRSAKHELASSAPRGT